ncbi:hypothetical protein [Planococcus sp. 4-30]|nr:hypothetical protein [Planococcus sp. 4-30]
MSLGNVLSPLSAGLLTITLLIAVAWRSSCAAKTLALTQSE